MSEIKTSRSKSFSHIARKRSKPHVGRKVYHLLNGLACFALYAFFLTRNEALTLLVALGGFFILFDLLRIKSPKMNRMGLKWFGSLLRREERHSLSGNSFFILGLMIITFFFPQPVVLLSVLYLAVGDPLAALVGTHWGKRRLKSGKSLEGAVANFLGCSLAGGLLSFYYFNLSLEHTMAIAVGGGLIATFVELLPLPIDDNFSIPVLSAGILNLLFSLFPLL